MTSTLHMKVPSFQSSGLHLKLWRITHFQSSLMCGVGYTNEYKLITEKLFLKTKNCSQSV